MVYMRLDAKTLREHLTEDEEDAQLDESGEGVTATRPNFVASFPAREATGLKIGADLPVAVDVANVHLFDNESGEPLR